MLPPPSLAARALAAALLATGCRPATGGAAFLARDSGSVRVVASARPLWRPGAEWRVDSLPEAEVRGLHEVRAALLLANGRIVAADGAAQELRWYDAHGRPLRVFRGDGSPGGELVSLSALGALDDGGVLAWDAAVPRAYAFAADGRLRAPPPFPAALQDALGEVLGVFGDGSLLAAGERSATFVVSREARREPVALVRASFAPPRADTLRTEPGAEEVTWGGESYALRRPAPFGRRTLVAVRGRRFWTVDTGRLELRAYDEAGRLRLVARAPAEPRPLAPADRAEARLSLAALARGDASSAAADSLLSWLQFPATWPAVADLRVDPSGAAWLRREGPGEERRWTVIDARGRLLGDVLLPRGLVVLDVGTDRILGVWTDAHGNPHLRTHRIRR